MLLGEFISTLAANSGIPADSPELKALLSNTNVSGCDVPDSVINKIQSSHLTLDAAKNNKDVLFHFKAQLYNGVDSELNSTLTEMGVIDALKADFETEKSTPKRISLALKKISALEKEKAGASKGDKTELQKEIDRLNGSISDARKQFDAEKQLLIANHQNEILDYDLSTMLAGHNYALPKEMAQDMKIKTAKMVVNQALQTQDAKFVRENGALKLKRVSNDTDYFDASNQKVEAKKFIDGVLAQNNLLVTSAPAATTAPTFTTAGSPAPVEVSHTWESAQAESQSVFGK